MKVDVYTKVVLTVISLCLVLLTIKAYEPGVVHAAQNDGRSSSKSAVQAVRIVGMDLKTLPVTVPDASPVPVVVKKFGDVKANELVTKSGRYPALTTYSSN